MLKRRLLLGINGGGGGTKLSPPQFVNPTPGLITLNANQSYIRVVLNNPNASGTSYIQYTTDGTIPSATNGTTYSAAIQVYPPGKTINAICIPNANNSSLYSASDVNCGVYCVTHKPLSAPRISPSDGTYTSSITVEMINPNPDPTITGIYYSIGEYSDPINNGTLYTAPFTLSTSGDYHIKAVCKSTDSSDSISAVTTANYTLDIEAPNIPEPFKESSLIVRMYLNNDGPSQILSSSFDYTNWNNKGIRVLISDGTNGEIIEYNNYTRIDSSGWTGTYTVPTNGYYFVIINLPESEIPSLLFKNNTNITDIEYIAPEITRIGSSGITVSSECALNTSEIGSYGAFRGSSLRTIFLDRVSHTTYTDLKSGESLTIIGAASFKDCTSVIEVEFPKDITHICSHAFQGMNRYEDSLREIYLPTSLQYIGYNAFGSCFYVQDYHLEDCGSLQRIYSLAFVGNQSMATITIPASVTTIDSYAFSNTQSQSVDIFDCCRLVEVINKSAITLNTDHNSGIRKYCLRYSTSGSSLLNPRILIEGAKFLSFKPSGGSRVNYLVHFIPTYNQYNTIELPAGDRTIETYIVNTAALAKTPVNQNISTSFVSLSIPSAVTEMKNYALVGGWGEIETIFLLDGTTAPTISSETLRDLRNNGSLIYWWEITNTSTWMSNAPYYLGYKNWDASAYGP